MFLEYIGSRYPGGVVEDFQHIKYYFGLENGWTCEVPDYVATMILTNWGTDKFKPVVGLAKPEEKPKPEAPKPEAAAPKASKPKASKPKQKGGKKKK